MKQKRFGEINLNGENSFNIVSHFRIEFGQKRTVSRATPFVVLFHFWDEVIDFQIDLNRYSLQVFQKGKSLGLPDVGLFCG